jgi:hypothetical protein
MSARTNSLSSTTSTPEDISIPTADDPVPLLARVPLTPFRARPHHQHPLHRALLLRHHVRPCLQTRLLGRSTVCTWRPPAMTPAPPPPPLLAVLRMMTRSQHGIVKPVD